MLGILRLLTGCLATCACSLLVACGSSDGTAPGGSSGASVLSQAPHCPGGTDALKIEGTIAGGAIDDSRTSNINAGQENFTSGKFYTPISNLVPLASNQLTLTFTWANSLFFGETGAITGGELSLPATHPQAGAKYCVSEGEIGFVDGGSEDGVLKFAITEVKAGADCSGAATAVDLRGCYQ
ncbi:MAG TPA: hypothetical protein VER96_25375 [Polyangiaceae bacterium]|nr:hypothetical protein [Polyangiaceae bacterium]